MVTLLKKNHMKVQVCSQTLFLQRNVELIFPVLFSFDLNFVIYRETQQYISFT